MNLDNLTVVLVEPRGERNIGSVARAMANFGVSDLRLVAPQTDHLQDEARKMAVKASVLLEQATLYPDLVTALKDCHYAYATTRRFGKYRENFLHPDSAAADLISLLDHGRVALVFGREDKGLKTEEIDLCQRLITIPTCGTIQSMNLAQSVVICLYEVGRQLGEARGKGPGGRRLASNELLEILFDHMRRTLLDISYLNPQNPEHIMRSYRQILGRAALDEREVRVLRGLLSEIDRVERERRGLLEQSDD
ncbi:MAG: RNA methyltransferase [Desulfuromonadales bacterium]|nr:RNA methyltransferase [Desulfuromonadales bacterium]